MMDYLVEYFRKEIDGFYRTDQPDFHPTETPNLNLHMHNHMELYIFISGHANFFIDHKFYSLQGGSLIFINNDQVHGPHTFDDVDYRRCAIHFSPLLAKQLSSSTTNLLQPFQERKNVVALTEIQLQKMIELARRLVDELNQPVATGHELLLPVYLTDLLVHAKLFSETQPSTEHNDHLPEIIKELLEYIQSHIADSQLSLERIAQHFNHHKIYLNRIFKEKLGISIYQYILMSRVSMAKRLLEESSDVQYCCEACGFNDYNNFIRTFKRFTGKPPKQYSLSMRS